MDNIKYGIALGMGFEESIEEQIAIARQKAGIRGDEPVALERFEVVRHY